MLLQLKQAAAHTENWAVNAANKSTLQEDTKHDLIALQVLQQQNVCCKSFH